MSARPAAGAWLALGRARFAGKRVHVLGLGLFGGQVALVRHLVGLGARVTVSDPKPSSALEPSLAALADLPGIEFLLGAQPPLDTTARAELLAPTPAVPPHHPHIQEAARRAIPVITEIGLFLEACPAPITAVTGSAGKSTIVALIGAMHREAGHRTWVGGNIGNSLLGELDRIQADDRVVLELSSFQLARLPESLPPFEIAILASIYEHHLDWHGDFAAYAAAKERIFAGQDARRHTQLRDAPPVPEAATPLRGLIMRRNAGLAAMAARAAGVDEPAIARALAGFRGLPHRFEEVARLALRGGGEIVFINASKATSPRTAASAVAAAEPPLAVIHGGATFAPGHEEELDPLAWAATRAHCVLAIGQASGVVRLAVPQARPADDLAAAVEAATRAAIAAGGGTVLLAPGFPSYDAYANYEERGAHFRRLVHDELVRWARALATGSLPLAGVASPGGDRTPPE